MSAPRRDKVGATPAKLALTGVLVLMLIGVIASNFSGADDALTAARPEEAPVAEAALTTAAAPAAEAEESLTAVDHKHPFGPFAVEEVWPKASLKEATRFDPFARAPWAVIREEETTTAEAEDAAQKLDQLRNAQNAIIFMAGDTRRARIGEHEFQVGDVIGRFKIADITPTGVVLSEIDDE